LPVVDLVDLLGGAALAFQISIVPILWMLAYNAYLSIPVQVGSLIAYAFIIGSVVSLPVAATLA